MKPAVRNIIIIITAHVLLAAAVLAVLFTGVYNFAADDEHWPIVSSTIAKARNASIESRAKDIQVPALTADTMIIAGAGNYQAMCAQCHLSPGVKNTELRAGLYPKPPILATTRVDPAIAFWTIKHGVKASGMPAWGHSMPDKDIWNLVAFLQKMPSIDAAAYRDLVGKSSGHAHNGEAVTESGKPSMPEPPHGHDGTQNDGH